MKLVIAGASGFIGTELVVDLRRDGHQVTTLVRRSPVSESEVEWHPDRGELDPAALAGADAVISLSGAGVADKRWTPAFQRCWCRAGCSPPRPSPVPWPACLPELRPGVFSPPRRSATTASGGTSR